MLNTVNEYLACFSLGTNLGDRVMNLDMAKTLIADKMGAIEASSGVYESPSWGYSSNMYFYNTCLAVRSSIKPLELMELALTIEKELGRTRSKEGYSDRVIDIDLLLCGSLILDHPRLILPHPRMSERRFVLQPMTEILPDQVHPGSGLTMAELLARCKDSSELRPV